MSILTAVLYAIPSYIGPHYNSIQQYYHIFFVYLCFYLPISIRAASLILWQSYKCHRTSEATQKNMGKIKMYKT